LKAIATPITIAHWPIGIWYLRPKKTITMAAIWPMMPSERTEISVRRRMLAAPLSLAAARKPARSDEP
jgi:uncharacterized membrane protein YjjB (DUF3815 family)